MALYSDKLIEHFQNPHNYGKIDNASGIGKVGNVVCGDVMYLYIKVDKNEVIKDIKFETLGCAAAIASSSVVTDLAKGKTIKQALKIESEDVVKSLGNLPIVKTHCSLLAVDALVEAIHDYLKKNNKDIPEEIGRKHKILEKQRKEIEERYAR
ncbi:nitrogen fixation protein NifU [Parcubacteria bacterium DG_72]|nr:MAG: nitrogen fixation protein NifU [Parcubacteria bacterium DG_72]